MELFVARHAAELSERVLTDVRGVLNAFERGEWPADQLGWLFHDVDELRALFAARPAV